MAGDEKLNSCKALASRMFRCQVKSVPVTFTDDTPSLCFLIWWRDTQYICSIMHTLAVRLGSLPEHLTARSQVSVSVKVEWARARSRVGTRWLNSALLIVCKCPFKFNHSPLHHVWLMKGRASCGELSLGWKQCEFNRDGHTRKQHPGC